MRRVLFLVGMLLFTLRVTCALAGCADTATAVKDVESVSDPHDDAELSTCRERARVARDAGAAPDAAYGVYFECTKEAGLR